MHSQTPPSETRRWRELGPASPPAEPDPAKPGEPPKPPEIPPDKEPPGIDEPPPDVVPVPVREPPLMSTPLALWLSAVTANPCGGSGRARRRRPGAAADLRLLVALRRLLRQ